MAQPAGKRSSRPTLGSAMRGAVIVAALAIISVGADAQAPKMLSAHRDWSVFSYTEHGKKVCYAAAKPANSVPSTTKRGEIFFLVTFRPAEKVSDEVSVQLGYPVKDGSEVAVDIDGKKFELFTDTETAWARTAQIDKAIVQAMIKGSDLVVRGASARGTKTTDHYSLQGFKAAHEALVKACPG
ncbi:MAG: hypothetical protein EXQ91_05200 [Alphaproteobacteria bacterium]|nr:hypothetical protein [Alphaproteobacteria bacterium]